MMNRRRVVETVLYAAVLSAVAVMAVSNWRLRQRLEDATALLQSSRVAPRKLQAGERLAFTARDRQGRTVTLGRNAAEPLLVVVDPNCSSCEMVLRELREIPRRDVAVVAIVPSQQAETKIALAAGTPLYTVSRASAPQLVSRLGGVPRVIRMSPDGVVGAVCHSLKECV